VQVDEYPSAFRPGHEKKKPTEQESRTEVRFEFEPAPHWKRWMLHFAARSDWIHWYRPVPSRVAFPEPVIARFQLSQNEARYEQAPTALQRAIGKFGNEASHVHQGRY
jgi:hypothetical protein